MPAVSKAQQRFFGMVRAAQKGEMEAPSAEVSKAASSMSKSDVKKFAKTKHKGLPNKVDVKEGHMNKTCKAGYYYCYTDKKCKPIPKGMRIGYGGMLKQDDESETKKNGKKNGNGNGNGNGVNGGSSNGNGGSNGGGVSEATKYDRYDKEAKQFKKSDARMKFGKFYDKAKEARDRLRPGEVKRYDKNLGKYVSNKD